MTFTLTSKQVSLLLETLHTMGRLDVEAWVLSRLESDGTITVKISK